MGSCRFLPLVFFSQLSLAWAQPAPNTLEQAGRIVIDEAAKAAQHKDWATCRTKAAGVWDTVKNFKIAGLLGSCELELGMFAEAALHLDYYIQHDDGSDAKRTQGIRSRHERTLKEVARVDVTCSEVDAVIIVDGQPMGSAPRTLYLGASSATFSAEKTGYLAESQTLSLTKGQRRSINLVMKPQPIVAPHDANMGVGSVGPKASSSAIPSASSTAELPPPDKPLWPAVLLFGVSAATGGVGGGLLAAGLSARDDANAVADQCGAARACVVQGQEHLNQADALTTGAIISFSVAGAAAIAGVVWLTLPPSPATGPHAEIRFVPWFAPSSAGVQLQSSF